MIEFILFRTHHYPLLAPGIFHLHWGGFMRRTILPVTIIITTLMLLGFAGSALAQHRIVKLNSSQVQGQGLKADAILVAWDDGQGRQRWSYVSLQGPVKFGTGDAPHSSPNSPSRFLSQNGPYRNAHYFTSSREEGDTILGYQTALIQVGQSTVHYSGEVGMALKVLTAKDDTVEISEAVSVDAQGNFDPRTVDLNGVEQAAVSAEAAGQKDYARQIGRLVRRWQQAAANWP